MVLFLSVKQVYEIPYFGWLNSCKIEIQQYPENVNEILPSKANFTVQAKKLCPIFVAGVSSELVHIFWTTFWSSSLKIIPQVS